MAAILTGVVGEVASLLGGSGLGATVGRGALGGVAAIAASQLLKAVEADLGAGGDRAATARKHTPDFVIVDVKTNKIVRAISRKKVYTIITQTRRRPRSKSSRERVIILPAGSRDVEVR